MLAALLVSLAGASSPRPHVAFSFIHSPLVPRDALRQLLPASRAPVAMSTAASVDAAELLGHAIALPFRLLARLCNLLGALLPESLPSWWTVPEVGEHLLGAASILFSNLFYVHYAIQQFRSRRPFLGLLLLAAAGASTFYHGLQVMHGASESLTHKACFVDTGIALTSGAVYLAKCGLPRPHLSIAACCTFFIGPSCAPLYAVSHSAWHFVSAYTAYAMAECAHDNTSLRQLLLALPAQLAALKGRVLRLADRSAARQLVPAAQADAPAAAGAGASLGASTAVAMRRRALGRSRLQMAERGGGAKQLQQRFWARWLGVARARAARSATGTAGAGGRGTPLPTTAERPLSLLLSDCAGAVRRFVASAPASLGGALRGLFSAVASFGAAFSAQAATAARGRDGAAQVGALLSALGGALVAAPARLEAGWAALAKLAASALPERWQRAASGAARRASDCVSTSSSHLIQLVLWKRRAHSGARMATGSALR